MTTDLSDENSEQEERGIGSGKDWTKYYSGKEGTDILISSRKYASNLIEKVREMTYELENKAEVARRLNIPYHRVTAFTQDIRIHNIVFGEKTPSLLKEIIEKGYAYLSNWKSSHIRILKKHFPSIQVVRFKGGSVAFLEVHKDDAMREMLKHTNKKVWSYKELSSITKLFNSDLTGREKRALVGVAPACDKGPVQHTLDEW